jgi:hypothetical protein
MMGGKTMGREAGGHGRGVAGNRIIHGSERAVEELGARMRWLEGRGSDLGGKKGRREPTGRGEEELVIDLERKNGPRRPLAG